MRVLPANKDYGWTPVVWLIYLGFFFIQPIQKHAGLREWFLTALGAAFLVVLYFAGYWVKGWRLGAIIAGLTLLGVVYAPFNEGSSVLFIYAAAFAGYMGSTPTAAKILISILAVVGLEAWVFHLPDGFWIPAMVFSALIGAVNIHYAERQCANEKLRVAHEEVQHLARVAERERIARDLHDVLGHTLSVIILKSELAGKLIDRDPEKAKAEIQDVEQTSRKALAEVRSTIRGYNAHSLEAELKQARATLETAGVTVKAEAEPVSLSPVQESVVALIVREAVTNVVRHASARNCLLRLARANKNCVLEIQDDGHGGFQYEGNGLRGMRERVEALGGTLERETSSGTRLSIQFPLTEAKADGPQ
jgi:two-component system sensor histidine kinase DesK